MAGDADLKVAFIGLGTMGSAMASNLIRRGFELTVHNRTRDKEEPIAQLGAGRAASPAEAARTCGIVVLMVSDTDDVEEVLFGPSGVATGASSGTLIVDMSSIDPGASREFAARLTKISLSMIDAPVSGGSEGAQAGTLSIMVGGSDEDVARATPVLEALGTRITHVGPAGSGQIAKAVNQVIVGGTLLAVAEGMLLGMRAGLDMPLVVEALEAGAAGSWLLSHRADRMISGDFPLGFKLGLHRKDLRIALGSATEVGAELPGVRLVAQLEDALIERGFGDSDISLIVRAIDGTSGPKTLSN